MVKPHPVESAEYIIPRRKYGEAIVPSVPTSAWTTSDGAFAQFLANYFPEARECTITLDSDGYTLYGLEAPIRLKRGKNCITVPPLCALMIEKG